MNYKKIYKNLIKRAKNRIIESYTERHHIIPRCLGGTDDKKNIVRLTPEEHYLAHQLLIKIFPKNRKLIKAAAMMVANRENNKLYGWLRRKLSVEQSKNQMGKGNSQYGTMWITDGINDKKIKKHESIPNGWVKGRYEGYQNKLKKEKLKLEKKKFQEENKKLMIDMLRELHEIYSKEGFEKIKKQGYPYTRENLIMAFAKYLPEFVPQPRIARVTNVPSKIVKKNKK